ncbi:MAG: hypothetical protein ACJAYP_000773 [Flavobacterium sp.]|jgi:hypothetical protein
MELKIEHQEDKTIHTFNVIDPDNLTSSEVKQICIKMRVKAIFVNGKYYNYS